MTVKKAIKILDWLIEIETNRAEGFVDPKHSWNHGFDCMRGLGEIFANSKKKDIEVLQILRKELVPKCNHPKKMQDVDSNGNRYCMDCNLDL